MELWKPYTSLEVRRELELNSRARRGESQICATPRGVLNKPYGDAEIHSCQYGKPVADMGWGSKGM